MPYAGSEGYSPVAYLPQATAAVIARALDLDFLPTLYLMRFAGLAALTALVAFAIALAPQLGWALLAIAMLPAALYGRSVISADGSTLAAAMVVTALWLRALLAPELHRPGRQAFWLTLGALTKPTNLAFVLLELSPPAGTGTTPASARADDPAADRRRGAVELVQQRRYRGVADGRNYRSGFNGLRPDGSASAPAR